MKTASIHQPQYIPYPGYFHKLANCDIFVSLDNVNFEKNGWQNRNRIKTAQGWQWLTIPIVQKSEQLIKDTLIDNKDKWSRKHWQALVTNYSKAPFFREFAGRFEELYLREWTHLEKVNREFVRVMAEVLEISRPIIDGSEINAAGSASVLLIDICKKLGCERYLAGPGGAEYMDTELFAREEIEIIWQDYHCQEYSQLYPKGGFVENLSVIDMIFNLGKGARKALGLE